MKGHEIMNIIRKRLIAIAVVASMALTSVVGCSSDSVGKGGSASSSSSVDEAVDNVKDDDGHVVVTPFQVGDSDDLNGIKDPNAPDLDESSNSDDSKSTTAVTAVAVTDANGNVVTDAKGQTVTEVYVAGGNNNSGNNSNNNSNNNSSNNNSNNESGNNNNSNSDYKSSTDSMYCLWIDISKDIDYVFNDQFIKITLKIKDGIPNKDYAVRFNPDFSSVAGVSVHPDLVKQGTIRVGSGSIAPMDVSSDNGFVAYGDNVACKQGDTIDYYINLKNNPGLAAILVWFYYDKNAMEVLSVEPAGDFDEISKGSAQVGTRPAES